MTIYKIYCLLHKYNIIKKRVILIINLSGFFSYLAY